MAHAPLHPCNWPGCAALTNERFCATHRATSERRREQTRPSARARGYGGDWATIRALVLAEEPICRICGVAPSREVDHIVPLRQGGTHARANLRGLCIRCHRKRHAHSGGGANL